jgi:hypothetical protein
VKLIRPLAYSSRPVCEYHLHFGVTPCPWPECKHGVEDDEFSLDVSPSRGMVTRYRRQRWISPDSQPYYSWIGDDWRPAFLDCVRLVNREMERLKLRQSVGKDTVYHYTDLNGLKGILDSQAMWLTDYAYLNDSTEMEHGLGLVKEKLLAAIDDPKYAKVADVFSSWVDGLVNHKHRICISSYSLDGDSLSQWRAYGSVAIGFKPDLSLAGWNSESSINSVIYERDKQELYIDYFLNHVLQAHEVDVAKIDSVESLDLTYQGGVHSTINLVACLKNPGFADEREVRVAYVENPEFAEIGMTIAPKKFRVSADAIIPYVTTRDLASEKSKPELPIREVVVGPTISPKGERSIREYLDHLGLEKVELRRSSIPYRK